MPDQPPIVTNPTGSKNLIISLSILGSFILGAALSYGYLSYTSASKPVAPAQTQLPPATLSPLAATFEKIVEKQKNDWAEAISKISVDFTLKGEIIEVQPVTKGKNITLQTGQTKAIVFVWDSATILEGQVGNFSSWKSIKSESLQVGDKVTIRSNTDLVEGVDNVALLGWWVFKEI